MRGGRPSGLMANFDTLRADYDAMKSSRFVRTRIGLAPQGGSADYHLRNETQYLELIEKSRDAERNDNILGKTIERSATNIVSSGFTLCPNTGDSKLDAELYYRWQEFTEDPELCDIAGELTWQEQEQIAVHSMLRDGDVFALGTQDGHIQMIEGHLVRNPKGQSKNKGIVIGVELNDVRRRVRYHVRKESSDPQRTASSQESTPYEVRDENGVRQAFHFYNPLRVSATRGVTALAPIFQISGMFEDVNFAKVVQAQVVSCFAIFRKRELKSEAGLPSTSASYGSTAIEQTAGGDRLIDNLEPGAEITGAPGESFEGFSPDVPNTNYFEHAKLLLTMIGINLGMPFVMVMMDGSDSNYSGARIAIDEARRGFRKIQRGLRDKWHRPIYRWKLEQWIADDPILAAAQQRLGKKFYANSWRLPAWPYINPLDEAAGQLLRVRNGLTSPRRLHGELSQDWEEIADETIDDNGYAINRAIKMATLINSKLGENDTKVHWREIISLPTPDGLNLSMPIAATPAKQNGKEASNGNQ